MWIRVSLIALVAASAPAQLNLLTPREAIQIARLIPEVAEAQRKGFCPRFGLSYGETLDRIGMQVRGGCGERAGQLIGRYEIDLRIGAVFEGEVAEPVKTSAIAARAKRLLERAEARILTPEESRCLALEAAKSLPGWGGQPGHEVSVEPTGPFALRFDAHLRIQNPPLRTDRVFTVDRATAHVHDDHAGAEVMAPNVVALAALMLAVHRPIQLSDDDALDIARLIPEIQAQAQKPCSVFYVGGPLSWENILVEVQSYCEGSADESHTGVAINPESGALFDYSDKPLTAPAAALFAQKRLQEIRQERIKMREKIKAACSSR